MREDLLILLNLVLNMSHNLMYLVKVLLLFNQHFFDILNSLTDLAVKELEGIHHVNVLEGN